MTLYELSKCAYDQTLGCQMDIYGYQTWIWYWWILFHSKKERKLFKCMLMCHFWNRTTAPSNACNFGFRLSYNILRGFKLCGFTPRIHGYQTLTLRISHREMIASFSRVRILFLHTCMWLSSSCLISRTAIADMKGALYYTK